MTDAQLRDFLSTGTRTGKLSTTGSDGSPHVAPVWFLPDNGAVVFTTGKNTVKGRNLMRDDRAALCVDDERPPYAFALLRGRAEITEDLGEIRTWATRIAARYVGDDRAAVYGERNAVPGELLVRMRIEKAVAVDAVAD